MELPLRREDELRLIEADWQEGKSHKTTQSCVRKVDVDINWPESLDHPGPLPPDSPLLRPPRGRS